jgi:16S rRNA (cytosine967-C5)-methyltransferase
LHQRITAVADRPCEELDRTVRVALELGTFEVVHSRTQPHAAVHQGVELAKALRAGRAKGFVNAVLRRVGQDCDLAPSVNHPQWLVDNWKARFGEEATDAWCERNDLAAPLSLVFRDTVTTALVDGPLDLLPARAGGAELERCFWVQGEVGPVEKLPGYDDGDFWVMDPAAVVCADLVGAGPGDRVLDACAAPGGKSLRLAQQGAEVLACDRSAVRLERLQQSVERVGYKIASKVVDWERSPKLAQAPFDAVLVDAPCTGLGTIRRHPEIRWRSLPTDPAALAIRQLPILTAASKHVREGGTLVYSVCSPMEEEGSGVIRAFLLQEAGYVLEKECLLAPPKGDEDAFYAARLRRSP